jgi:hypothetical protein
MSQRLIQINLHPDAFTYLLHFVIKPVVFGPGEVTAHNFHDGVIILNVIVEDPSTVVHHVLLTLVHQPVLLIHLYNFTFETFHKGGGGKGTDKHTQASLNLIPLNLRYRMSNLFVNEIYLRHHFFHDKPEHLLDPLRVVITIIVHFPINPLTDYLQKSITEHVDEHLVLLNHKFSHIEQLID